MIKLLFPVPRKITIAFSGGVDSVAAVDFLDRNHEVSCAFFHHGTDNSERALKFVEKFCADRNLPLYLGFIHRQKPDHKSMEEHWRDERYKFLRKFGTVVTAHHLNDCVETYVWSALHGDAKVIPYTRNNVIRPFLLTTKNELINWCERKGLEWCIDTSNDDDNYMRNYIRKHLIPHAYHVNPGLEKVVKKIILDASQPE